MPRASSVATTAAAVTVCTVHPEPPRVTITNPNDPAGTADLLASGSERAPWRPSKGQWKSAAAALVVTALFGGTWTWIAHVRAERAADRAAIADVHLVALPMSEMGYPTGEANETLIGLRNDGTRPVHLVSVAVTNPFRATFRNSLLPAGVAVEVSLTLHGGCDPARLNGPVTMTARVRTSRGQEVTRDLSVEEVPFALGFREQCGYRPLESSLDWNVTSSALHGRTLRLNLEATNASTLPLTVRRIHGTAPGLVLHLSSKLPLALPPLPAPDKQGRAVKLTMTVRVADCAAFAAFADYYSYAGESGLGLRADVVRGAESAEVPFPTWVPDPAAVAQGGALQMIDAGGLLLHACGRG